MLWASMASSEYNVNPYYEVSMKLEGKLYKEGNLHKYMRWHCVSYLILDLPDASLKETEGRKDGVVSSFQI